MRSQHGLLTSLAHVLSILSEDWQRDVGVPSTVSAWPTYGKNTDPGCQVANNALMSEVEISLMVAATPYSIGVSGFGFDRVTLIPESMRVHMRNKAFKFVEPTHQTFSAAAADLFQTIDAATLLVDKVESGAIAAWPLVTVSYWVVRTQYPAAQCHLVQIMKGFITATLNGSLLYAENNDFVRPPDPSAILHRLDRIRCGESEEQQSATQQDLPLLQGVGASFPDTVYQKWLFLYNLDNKDVRVSYVAVGSTQGKKVGWCWFRLGWDEDWSQR